MSSKKNTISSDGKQKPRKRRLTRKQRWRKRGLIAGAVALPFIALYALFHIQPRTTIQYPICRTFAERRLLFPESMHVNEVERPVTANNVGVLASSNPVDSDVHRVWEVYYTYTGPFGEARSDVMSCKFAHDPQTGGLYIEEADLNRTPVDQGEVDTFNKTIPAIMATNPSTIIPRHLPEDLVSLKPLDGGSDDDETDN